MADFNWDQFQQAGAPSLAVQNPSMSGRSFDPSQAMPNSGIGGYGSFGGATGMPAPPVDQVSGAYPYTGGGSGVGENWNVNPEAVQWLKDHPGASLDQMSSAQLGSSFGTGVMTGTNGQVQPSGDPQAYFNQLFPGDTLTPDMLTQHEAELKAQGIELVRNAAGVPGKIKLPNGQVVDVIQGAGSGLNRKQWLTGGGAPVGLGTLNQFGQSSGFMAAPFVDPTAEDALKSPGLQFALEEANRMGQNSAAARGTLLNGRTQQALQASNIQNALQGYGGVYNRAYQTFTRNQDAPFNKFSTLAELGQRAASAS